MPATTTVLEKRLRSTTPYSSKIIKAGALIGDTKTLLSHWDVDTSVEENINRVQRHNVFGKASRSRVEDILAIFRQRYLTEKSVTKALVALVRGKFPTAALDRLLYFHSARADRLLHDAVIEILLPMHARGLVDINVQNFHRAISRWVDEGKTTGPWSESTVVHAVRGPISASYGFEDATGEVKLKIAENDNKRIEPNTVTVMISEEISQKTVGVYLLDATTGTELTAVTVDVAISM